VFRKTSVRGTRRQYIVRAVSSARSPNVDARLSRRSTSGGIALLATNAYQTRYQMTSKLITQTPIPVLLRNAPWCPSKSDPPRTEWFSSPPPFVWLMYDHADAGEANVWILEEDGYRDTDIQEFCQSLDILRNVHGINEEGGASIVDPLNFGDSLVIIDVLLQRCHHTTPHEF
jgi:hypothetical protein